VGQLLGGVRDSNGGQSFHPVYPPGKPRQWAVDVISPSQWRLTYGKEILATNNGGTSWFTVTSNTVLRSDSYAKGAPPAGSWSSLRQTMVG